jgi:hypothetical protein
MRNLLFDALLKEASSSSIDNEKLKISYPIANDGDEKGKDDDLPVVRNIFFQVIKV